MLEQDFNNIIDYLLKHKISITLRLDGNNNRWYILNTLMKSDLEIAYEDGELCYKGRYDKQGTCDDLDGLLHEVKGCMHGRDYACSYWIDLLVLHKKITVKTEVTTKTTYS